MRSFNAAVGFALLIASAAVRVIGAEPESTPFTFAAFGCMPYQRNMSDSSAFTRLIAEVNRHSPAFSVHLGDIIGSDEKSTDDVLLQRRREFNTFTSALIYTPGDNEWTDSHSEKGGRYVPTERLAKIRELFFPDERSLGQKPIPLITQRREPRYAKFVENARWSRGGVVFATVHVVGSHNNDQSNVPGAVEEWRERDDANETWIRATFAEATQSGAPGVAFFFQADPFAEDKGRPGYEPGFERFLKTLEEESRAYAKPVLPRAKAAN
jgi:hypothetical protein